MATQQSWYDNNARVGQFFLWIVAVVWGLWFVVCVLGGSHIEFVPNR